jgi:hypothetical protein
MTSLPVMHLTISDIPTQHNDPLAATRAEFGRLIHAAIINPGFRNQLLANPLTTIDKGYIGESFQFSGKVREQLREIQAGTLEEFSSRVLEITETPSIVEMAVPHYR